MKKTLIPIFIAMCLLCAMPVYAADPAPPPVSVYEVQDTGGKPYPIDIQTKQENGFMLLQKTFEVAPDYDPQQLVDEAFEQDGYRYSVRNILKEQLPSTTETKLAFQTISTPCESKDEKAVLKQLAPIIDHTDGDFSGQLRLDTSTLVVEADGYQFYQYTIMRTKEFSSLDRNDPVYMEKNTEQNGVSMKLMDVDWSAQAETQVAGILIPTQYRGNAIYQGIATGSKATGYTATVSYIGEITKTTQGNIKYTLVYKGSEIPPEKEPVNPAPIAAAATASTGGIFYAVFFFLLKKNVKIYNMQDGQPVLIDKQRVKQQNPIVDLSNLKHKSTTNAYRIALDKSLAMKLAGKSVSIVTNDKTLQHLVSSNGGAYQFDVYA